jgi:hypothetical protein
MIWQRPQVAFSDLGYDCPAEKVSINIFGIIQA